MRGLALVLVAALLPGCAQVGSSSDPADPDVAEADEEDLLDPWAGRDRVVLVDEAWTTPSVQAGGCMQGQELERTGESVLPGTGFIEATVASDAATGHQAGLQLGEEPIQWLDPVSGGERTFQVPMAAGMWEDPGQERLWRFWHRDTVTGPDPCEVGTTVGEGRIRIEAVRAVAFG